MSKAKSPDHVKVVRNRWAARVIWDTVVDEMPDSIEVLNNKDGERERREVSIKDTVDWLRALGRKIFHRNIHSHYVGVSIDDPKRISYADCPSHKYSTGQRRITSIQRYLARNFDDYCDMNERAVEMFVEKFKRESIGDIEGFFTIVKGSKIVKYYDEGWGKHTCMTGSDAYLTSLYAINDDVCSMLVYKNDEGEVRKGRALLWKAEDIESGDIRTICDRVYPNSGPHIEIFRAYCDKHGIPCRVGNSHPVSSWSTNCTERKPLVKFTDGCAYTVRVIPREDGGMPFTDSFHWGSDFGSSIVMTTDPTKYRCDHVYNSCSGAVDDIYYPECQHCGDDDCENITSCADGYWWHTNCYDEAHFNCGKCSYAYRTTNANEVRVNRSGDHEDWCHDCVSSYATACIDCAEYTRSSLMDGTYCTACSAEHESQELKA